MSSASQQQAYFERAIADGQFATRAELLQCARSRGLQVTRNGEHYVGFKSRSGNRFRLQLPERLHIELERRHRQPWSMAVNAAAPADGETAPIVYAIVAVAPGGVMAAYVGSTSHLEIRRYSHSRAPGTAEGRASGPLKLWALKHGAQLHMQALAHCETTKDALLFEGVLTEVLRRSAWLLPGVETWAAARRRAMRVLDQHDGTEHVAEMVRSLTLEAVQQWPVLQVGATQVSPLAPRA